MKNHTFMLSLLVVLSGLAFGVSLSTLCFIVTGICLCVLICNNLHIVAVTSAVVSFILCNVISDITISLCFILGGVLPGILLGMGFRKNLSLPYLTLLPSLGFVSLWVYIFSSYKNAKGTNMFKDIGNTMAESATKAVEELSKNPELTLPDGFIADFSSAMTATVSLINSLIPAIIVIFSAGFGFLITMLSKKALRFNGLKSFSHLQVPGSLLAVSFICMLGFSLSKNNMKYLFVNIALILFAYCFLCGISLLDFYMRKKINSVILRVFIYLIILFFGNLLLSGLISVAFLIAAMSDCVFDFRKLRLPKSSN